MKDKVINLILNQIKKYCNYDKTKLLEIKYGLESLYLTITKLIVIFIISLFLRISKELLLLILFYGILRLFTSGMHGKSSIQCWIISIITFIAIPLLIKYINIPKIIMIISYIFMFIIIYKYAPSGTEKRAIKNPKKKLLLKYISLFICSSYMFIITFFANDYMSNILFYSCLLSVIFILPITYKLLGVKYRN